MMTDNEFARLIRIEVRAMDLLQSVIKKEGWVRFEAKDFTCPLMRALFEAVFNDR